MKSKEVQKKAALLSYVLWSGMEENKAIAKIHYPLYNELGFVNMRDNCSWCEHLMEYDSHDNDEKCRNCPLLKAGNGSCNSMNALFDSWAFSGNAKEKAICAGDIARVAWAEYKRLGG